MRSSTGDLSLGSFASGLRIRDFWAYEPWTPLDPRTHPAGLSVVVLDNPLLFSDSFQIVLGSFIVCRNRAGDPRNIIVALSRRGFGENS